MNPLFTGHIVADFLLQTHRLVKWKTASWRGLAVHAFIHMLFTAALILPFNLNFIRPLFAVAAAHGLIDWAKIYFQKKHHSSAAMFLTDQFLHLAVLLAVNFAASVKISFWNSPHGLAITFILFAAAFAAALRNFTKMPAYPLPAAKEPASSENSRRFLSKPKRLAIISLVFLIYLAVSAFL